MQQAETRAWAWAEFGDAKLRDRRRIARLVTIADDLVSRPTSIVANAFRDDAARQGAYDFLESRHVLGAPIEAAAGESCASRAASYPFVYVPVDGTGISITDPGKNKPLGELGPKGEGVGLKVLSAVAFDPNGVPVGLAGQMIWTRDVRPALSYDERKSADRKRPYEERESRHWATLIDVVSERLKEAGAKPWWVIDREGDAQGTIEALKRSEGLFTVRSNFDRTIGKAGSANAGEKRGRAYFPQRRLRAEMWRRRPVGTSEIEVKATPKRRARHAKLVVRTHRVTLRTRLNGGRQFELVELNVVWLREFGTTPTGEDPLDWMLFTNHPIDTAEAIEAVIRSYKVRWRIEEFHKTWKSAGCDVERTQLRGLEAMKKWATILAAVAVRIERLKHLARNEPSRAATMELTKYELQALVFLKTREKKKTETIGDNPTIAEATRWIADLGGYQHAPKRVPGAITIGRGLERVLAAAAVFEGLARDEK